MTTLARLPDPMMTTASEFMLLKDGPLARAWFDKCHHGRWQFHGALFFYQQPATRLLIGGKQSKTMGEESIEPLDWGDPHALSLPYPIMDDEHDISMAGEHLVHAFQDVEFRSSCVNLYHVNAPGILENIIEATGSNLEFRFPFLGQRLIQ